MKKKIGVLLSIGVLLVSCTKNALENTTASTTDCYFMTQAAYAHIAMAEATQLAGQKTDHEAVKALVSELSMDYPGAYNELKEISRDLKYSIPSTLRLQDIENGLHLLSLSGSVFDTAYIGRQIRNNLQMIDLFEAQVNGGHDPFLKRYAIKHLPSIKLHLYRADSILAGMNKRAEIASQNLTLLE